MLICLNDASSAQYWLLMKKIFKDVEIHLWKTQWGNYIFYILQEWLSVVVSLGWPTKGIDYLTLRHQTSSSVVTKSVIWVALANHIWLAPANHKQNSHTKTIQIFGSITITQPAITYSKLTIETLEQAVKC